MFISFYLQSIFFDEATGKWKFPCAFPRTIDSDPREQGLVAATNSRTMWSDVNLPRKDGILCCDDIFTPEETSCLTCGVSV